MLKNINLKKALSAVVISFSFIYLTHTLFENNELYFDTNFFISLSIYSILSFIALYGYDLNKLVGLILFTSITFLSPNLYPDYAGELFPVTYVLFALFLTYFIGIGMYKKWKTSL